MKRNALFEKSVANISPDVVAEVDSTIDAINNAYKQGYANAVDKAVSWWESELDVNDDESYREWEKQVIRDFKKAMEE